MVASAPITSYLDTLALAIAAGAAWWSKELRERDARGSFAPALTEEQLDAFERQLCLGMAKLLLENISEGISWRHWVVRTDKHPDKVLSAAATGATIGSHCFPFHTRMWLKTTADAVHVHVRQMSKDVVQIWPQVA